MALGSSSVRNFNPKCQAGNRTHTSAATQATAVGVLTHCAAAGTPFLLTPNASHHLPPVHQQVSPKICFKSPSSFQLCRGHYHNSILPLDHPVATEFICPPLFSPLPHPSLPSSSSFKTTRIRLSSPCLQAKSQLLIMACKTHDVQPPATPPAWAGPALPSSAILLFSAHIGLILISKAFARIVSSACVAGRGAPSSIYTLIPRTCDVFCWTKGTLPVSFMLQTRKCREWPLSSRHL